MFFGFPPGNAWSLEMFLACEYRHINIKADMSRHDVVKRHDFRSAMKSKEKLSSMTTMPCVLTAFTMEKRPPYIYIYIAR